MNSVLGPNTNLPREFLAPSVLLCCGEEPTEFLAAIQANKSRKIEQQSSYRCYSFWRFPDFLAGWTGIGTGCLEPLLFEILKPGDIKRIALVGTAGKFAHSKVKLTTAHLCDPARCAYTGLDKFVGDTSLRPKLPSRLGKSEFARAGILSTDLFYGYSGDALKEGFPLYNRELATSYHNESARADLVDMEVGQFYFLCAKYGGASLDAYMAFKGAANEMGMGQQQLDNSQRTIDATVNTALSALMD